MKAQILRLIALLIFASATMSGCSLEYREHHRHHHGNDRDHGDYGHEYRDNH